jgi:hypothetical protein
MKMIINHFYKEWEIVGELPAFDENVPRLKSNQFKKLTRSDTNSVKKSMKQETVEETVERFEKLIENYTTK